MTSSSSAVATVAVATSAATTPENLVEFPEFTFFVKGELFRKKGNLSKPTRRT